ncbi:polysaccharide biosynthesis protein [Photobacterium sp. 1_MG-2023]|nr:polysaccharide biosynthesis protein [Photobacterium sp. 1_MG-2023]
MVTGAGGSIGSELCKQIVKHNPEKLILLELSEFHLYSIHQEIQSILQNNDLKIPVIAALGNVQNQKRVQALIAQHDVHTLYHAAAYKHVPLLEGEHNVIEAISNNVFGTLAAVKAAIAERVEHFSLISTDKAVQPQNVMGASKRLAEKIVLSLCQPHTTECSVIRFGNVLDSSGSVVPLFKHQILHGLPVTVTDPEATRYFMSIPEAAQLVLQASGMGINGKVFVLDMGQPVKIKDLAQRLGKLLQGENTNIDIQYIGLRPGEKLHESSLISPWMTRTVHPKILVSQDNDQSSSDIHVDLARLQSLCDQGNLTAVRQLLFR